MEPSVNISNCTITGADVGISIDSKGLVKIKDRFFLAVKGKRVVPFRTEQEAMCYVARRLGWKVKDAYFSERLV